MASNTISDEKGEPAMGMLRVISKHGDDRVQWNEHDVQVGDAEAMAAIREAERIFAQQRAKGATAFHVEAGKPTKRIELLDLRPSRLSWCHG